MGLPIGLFLFQLWVYPASAVAVVGIRCSLAVSSVLRDGFLVPVQDSSLPLLRSLVSLWRSGCACLVSGLAASGWGCACGRCLRIVLDPGPGFPFVSLPCGRVVWWVSGWWSFPLSWTVMSHSLHSCWAQSFMCCLTGGWLFLLLWAWRWITVVSSDDVPRGNNWGSHVGLIFQFSLWIEYCWLLPCLPQGVLTRGCHGSLSWVSASLVWSSGCFWLLGVGSRPVVPLRSLASSHSGILCDASWGPSLFPHSLWRSLASCLVALPFASLTLVSRPWTSSAGLIWRVSAL